MLNIPAHTNCTNCGECCGVIPASEKEFEIIRGFLTQHPEALRVAADNGKNIFHCPFRDDKKHVCAIYPVRPLICRLYGVCKGMECPNGNSANIDGVELLDDSHDIRRVVILNIQEYPR